MKLDEKLAVLNRIYGVFDDFAGKLDVACRMYCAQCCTRNVTLTTLETYIIVDYLHSNNKLHLFDNLRTALSKKRFQPSITTNQLADFCIRGENPPEEEPASPTGKCPLLQNDECPIYPVRPFGCRCFVSRRPCKENGYADIDPFVVTVNNVFLQYIEHVDVRGCSGNLTDMLLFMESRENIIHYYKNDSLPPNSPLVQNRPMPALMIPPEHRTRIQQILEAIQGK